MPKIAFIRLYFDDFEHDTAHLSDEMKMKYLRLLWAAYQQGGVLPGDNVVLARLAGIERTKGWQKKVALLRRFFDDSSGFLRQRRIENELAKIGRDQRFGPGEALGRWGPDSDFSGSPYPYPDPDSEGMEGVGALSPGENFGGVGAATISQARREWPHADIDHLLERWARWTQAKGERLSDPDKAFLGFVRENERRRAK